MSTLSVLVRQPARGLGEAGRGRAVLAGSKKNHKLEETLVQFTLGGKKDNLSYIWLLATDLLP